jgi:PAS domain S-box-containing protein
MPFQFDTNTRAPLQSWDLFCNTYNSLMADATKHQESVLAIRQIAKANKWSRVQMQEAIDNIQQYVIVITDHLQKISFAGKGFQEMTGYTFEEAKGRNPKFLQGVATNKSKTNAVKEQLTQNETTEIILENYRKNGEIYLCKILIKPVFDINKKLVNYIAYEQEIAA